MISYAPLWKTLERQGVTIYALRNKVGLGGGTIQRLQKNDTVSTSTLGILCEYLKCRVQDIVEYVPKGAN